MVSAALALLVAGMGVGFGWQPMPDGTPRYEYIVQVEPQMLESLVQGQSIPIVSDVPEGIGPIARVRVVVGRGDAPKRRLVTQFKPETDGTPAGIVLTQYTESGAGRYGAPPTATPQYGAPASGGYDPYTQAAPGAGGTWNAGAAPPANPLRSGASAQPPSLPAESSWNGQPPVRVADSSAASPLQTVGAGLQDAVAPLQRGIEDAGNSVRGAADRFGDRTAQLLDDVGRSIGVGGQTPDAAAAAAAGRGAGASPAPVWNGGAAAAVPVAASGAGSSVPTASGGNGNGPGGGADWNAGVAAGAGVAVGGTAGPEAPPLVREGATGPIVSGGYGAPPAAPGSTGAAANNDAWANADDQRFRTGGGNAPVAAAPAFPATGPWPAAGPGAASAASQPGPILGSASGPIGAAGGVPEINSGMLSLPGGRDLDGGAAPTGGNIFAPATTGPPVFIPASTGAGQPGTPSGGLLAGGNWATGTGSAPPGAIPARQPLPATPASDARSTAAVLFAWVLLSGSAAGNIYLFWSYLDVRTKYRALVRKTARAVGSRFSAA